MSFKVKSMLVLLAAALMAVQASASVMAQDNAQKIAIVDVQALLSETSAAQSIQSQLEKKRQALQEEFEKYEQQIREEEKVLIDGRPSDNQEDFAKKRDELGKKIMETRRLLQQKKGALEKAVLEATVKLRDEILKIVTEISNEKGYTLVLSKQATVYSAQAFDITGEVKGKLEKTLSKIDLTVKE